jgi:hypothetical protein
MVRVEKTVFISYRRTNVPWALAVFQHLTHHGFDVFFDFMGIASGDFERVKHPRSQVRRQEIQSWRVSRGDGALIPELANAKP